MPIEPHKRNGKGKPRCHQERHKQPGQHDDQRACHIESGSKPVGEQITHDSAGFQRPTDCQVIWKQKPQERTG